MNDDDLSAARRNERIARAVLLAAGPEVTLGDPPPQSREHGASSSPPVSHVVAKPLPEGGIDLRAAVEEYENSLIRQALEQTSRNKNRAAQLLRINRTTLVEMVKRKGL